VTKLKAIIVDDEEGARDVLSNLLGRCCPDVTILAKCKSLPEAVELIKLLKPDVVFLDVQMPDYAGYEIINFFDTIDLEIIFATAFDQYAIKAFELSAVDYLVKPISRTRLIESVEKLKVKVKTQNVAEDYEILLQSIKKKEYEKIVIPELGNKRVINLSSIIAIEGKGAYSTVHLSDSKEFLVSKNLKYFETALPENSNFFRSHKSWIINLNHIDAYSSGKNQINLSGNVIAKLSKYRLAEFDSVLMEFS